MFPSIRDSGLLNGKCFMAGQLINLVRPGLKQMLDFKLHFSSEPWVFMKESNWECEMPWLFITIVSHFDIRCLCLHSRMHCKHFPAQVISHVLSNFVTMLNTSIFKYYSSLTVVHVVFHFGFCYGNILYLMPESLAVSF